MIITLNNFVLNDPNGTSGAYVDEPINGLGLPSVRTSSGNFSGRDGGYVGAQFYSMRLISLTGRLFAQTTAGLETARQNLTAALSSGTITMKITTNGGAQYLVNCYLDNLDLPIQRSPYTAPFMLTLIASDPNIYDNSAAGTNTVTVPLAVGGGITWPIAWTPVTWAPGAQPATINNTGNVLIYPIITLATPNIVTTNLVVNPSFETNIASWSAYHGATIAQSSAQAYVGTMSGSAVTSGGSAQGINTAMISGLSPSTTYTASAYVYAAAGVSVSTEVDTYDSLGGFLAAAGTATLNGTGGWQRVTATFTTGATATQAQFFLFTSSATTFYVDAVQLEQGASASTYFDGNTASTTSATYAWTGATNASASTRTLIGANASSPSITNKTTGQFFSFSGLTTNTGDVVTIDMYNRTVLLNGGSILPYVTTSSTWWGLQPGNNSINLTSNNSADTVTATVKWQAAYRSI